MKTLHNVSVKTLTVIAFLFGLTGPLTTFAATAPNLGAAATYSAFGKAGVTNDSNVGTTHIWGNVGADATNVTNLDDATQVDGIIDTGAGVEAAILTAYGQLAAEPDIPVVLNLAGNNTVGPGVYDVGATTLNGILTLSGAGVYIFRSSSSISVASGVGAEMKLTNGADACNVFWQIPTSMTIGVGAKMIGTILADTALISLGTNATLQGRALSRIAQVTLDSNQITEPTCTPVVPVVPTVNSSGGGGILLKIDNCPNGDFSSSYYDGSCGTAPIVSNTGTSLITPLIGLLKVPSPLALPAGSGSVTYNYTVWNLGGERALTNITLVDDKCSPMLLVSGDTNNNNKLDIGENWKYTCGTNLSETTTNTAVVTGRSDDIYKQTAIATAIATVVVGSSLAHPLINIVKVPSQLTPLPFGGGDVKYTYTVTNPGVVTLHNVTVSDDKCTAVSRVFGDINKNNLLETNETWIYMCQQNISVSTRNIATAEGKANGFTARSYAIANIIVAARSAFVPKLPNTGISPEENNTSGNMIILATLLVLISASVMVILKKRTL